MPRCKCNYVGSKMHKAGILTVIWYLLVPGTTANASGAMRASTRAVLLESVMGNIAMSPSCEMYVESPYIVNEDGKLIKRTAILMLKARSSRRDVLALQADCEKRTRNESSVFWFSPAQFSSGFESLAERIRRNPCISRGRFR